MGACSLDHDCAICSEDYQLMIANNELLSRVLEHEGFEARPYPDPLSGAEPYTFGHGLTWITERESISIVQNRLLSLADSLKEKYPWACDLDAEVCGVMIEMAFQMGEAGLGKFKLFLSALRIGDYNEAARQMLDSKWAVQTPSRAEYLADIVRSYH